MAYQFETLKVLVVDDNEPMRKLVLSMFTAFGCQHVDRAVDGSSGFEAFCQEKHDLIISDYMMKPIRGTDFLERVRTDPKSPNAYVPFILMTGFTNESLVLKARDTGITEFIAKPFSARDLYKRIENVIENPRQFIKSDAFFGPDRRRNKKYEYRGPYRRDTDVRPEDYTVFDVGFDDE